MQKFLILFLLVSSASLFAATDFEKKPVIEHQIRICDSEKKILKKLELNPEDSKFRSIFYVETPDQFYRHNGWVIRIKLKSDKATVDIKRRVSKNDILPDQKKIECEYDKHDKSLEKTCKLSSEMSLKDVKKVINNNLHWQSALSKDQRDWLEEASEIKNDAQFVGTLNDNRFEFDHDELGVITLDTVNLDSDSSINYHEISVRYPANEESKKAVIFEKFMIKKKILMCPGQTDWAINKFDVMTPVNFL